MLVHSIPSISKEANDANTKVNPKLSLNATLSSTADLKSIPLTYRCILVVGTMLYPWEARYCVKMSIACLFSSPTLRQTCTPNTSNPKSVANVFEKVLTATPPRTPICHQRISHTPVQDSLILNRVPAAPISHPPPSQHTYSKEGLMNVPAMLPALICP